MMSLFICHNFINTNMQPRWPFLTFHFLPTVSFMYGLSHFSLGDLIRELTPVTVGT